MNLQNSLTGFASTSLSAILALATRGTVRKILTFWMLISAYQCFWVSTEVTDDIGHQSVLRLFIIIWMLHMLNVLFAQGKAVSHSEGPMLYHLQMAYKMLWNARWIPIASQNDADASKELRNSRLLNERHAFACQRVLKALSIYCVNHVYQQALATDWEEYGLAPFQLSDFGPHKERFFRRLILDENTPTVREAVIRTWLVFHFLWTAWAMFTFIHCLLSALFVSLRFDEPSEWPPLYGSIFDAWTIQRFWNRYWHRIVYKTYQALSIVFCTNILHIKAHSWFGRTLVNLIIFLISGLVHAVVFQSLDVPESYLEIWWFMMNFIAVLLERSFITTLGKTQCARRLPSWMGRAAGYCWVFLFLFWSLPKSQYPKIAGR
jgi:hypothetical protein